MRNDTKPSSCVKNVTFRGQLSNRWLMKKDCAPWRWFGCTSYSHRHFSLPFSLLLVPTPPPPQKKKTKVEVVPVHALKAGRGL